MSQERKPAHHKKDSAAAGKFAEQKVARNAERGKQVWVWDVPPQPREETADGKIIASHPGIGHWERRSS